MTVTYYQESGLYRVRVGKRDRTNCIAGSSWEELLGCAQRNRSIGCVRQHFSFDVSSITLGHDAFGLVPITVRHESRWERLTCICSDCLKQ